MANKTKQTFVLIIIILLAAMSRLIPHPPNFTPVGAMALMGGAYLGRKWMALIIPLLALYLSDLVLNNTLLKTFYGADEGFIFYSGYMPVVYGVFILIVILGIFFLQKISAKSVLLTALIASIAFFLITNFGVWVSGTAYPKNIAGLIECYILALPFFKYTLLGNLVYSSILFAGFEYLRKRYLASEVVLKAS